MSLGDGGDNKDIRQRAKEFLDYGVLGCCPETKASLGKTIADANAPSQPEKQLPNVVNDSGYRYDPKTKYKPGMVLDLFPTHQSRDALHGQPNFGWVEGDQKPATADEMAESLRKIADGPRVVQEVWEVDKEGNPTKLVRSNDKKDEQDEEQDGGIEGKGLGRTLREMNPGNTLVARAAKKFGVWLDDLGKFRCPPGTPQANQFTDEFGTTCFAVSASQIANAVQSGLASRSGRFRMPRWKNNMPFYFDEFGQPIENLDVLEGRQDYFRVFNDSKSRVRARMIEMDETVKDLLRLYDVKSSSDDNEDLIELLKKLGVQVAGTKPSEYWSKLDPKTKKRLMEMGITKESLEKSERGFLMKYAELAITDPERLEKIGLIYTGKWGDGREASTSFLQESLTGAVKDVKYAVGYDPVRMAYNAVNQIEGVLENQRLGMRVIGASSEEEAASLMHGFVTNEHIWAGGMTASLGDDRFMAKGMHTGVHEFSHTIQMDAFVAQVIEKHGGSKSLSDFTSGDLMDLMTEIGDDVDLEAIGLVQSDLDKVAYMGGKYGRDEYAASGAVSELWKLETSAELYALREMGVIEGDDVDNALSWMDATRTSRSMEMRAARKKKNMKMREAHAAKVIKRPDGRPDHPDSPSPKTPRKPRDVKTPEKADEVGKSILEDIVGKLSDEERATIERIGDPRSHDVVSLLNPAQVEMAAMSIDAGHRFARKHGADLDEIDVTESRVLSRVAYDPKRQRLYVTYRDADGNPSGTYYYRKVQPETALEIHKAETKGKAINEIKRNHEFVKIDKIPDKIEKTSLTDANIASQVQFNLIPLLTALDKSEMGQPMRVVIPMDRSKEGGELVNIDGITVARIHHDGMKMADNEIILALPADARGIPFQSGPFDKGKPGSTTMLMMPPMSVSVLDDKLGRNAELSTQISSDDALEKMLDRWPSGSDAKEGRVLSSSRNKVEQVVATHAAMGEGTGRMSDGSTHPVSAGRIRLRNADIHDRHTSRGGSPTKPTKKYRDTTRTGGFASLGKIETPEERSFGRSAAHAEIISSIRVDSLIDPEVQRVIGDIDDRGVSKMVELAAANFHDGVDRRPRLRVSSGELDKVISDGGRGFTDKGHFSSAERQYQALIGIHPDTDDIDRPISGYVVHPAQDSAAREAMRRRGIQVGDSLMEWPTGQNPHGDIDADGDIEIVLKPEVSGRTAYGHGYGIDRQTRPVWLNSTDSDAIADALVHVDPSGDKDGSRNRVLNALSALIDGNNGYFTDSSSVKPVSTSQNEKTESFIKRVGEHVKASKPERLGAQIMGGFVNEEISEIRYPWSKISESSSDVDISDVVNKEPVSDRLRRLGFTDAEIEYFYKVNGDRSLDYISSATMGSLRDYRKAKEIKDAYESKGIPSVAFMHPAGMDPMDVSSYTPNPVPGMTPENALAKSVNEEVDAILEKMLKQLRKTRGKLWEMKPKEGALR